MKKSIRWICIIAGILVAAGICLAAVGWLFKGEFRPDIFNVGSSAVITEANNKKEVISIKPFTKLTIDASAMDVYLVKGDKYELEVMVPQELMPKVEESNGHLDIKQPKINNINIVNTHIYYKVTVPNDDMVDVDIECTSGDINIDSVNFTGFVSQTSGDLSISNVNSEDLSFGSTSGGLSVKNLQAKNMIIEHTSGSMLFDGVVADRINIEVTSGESYFSNVTLSNLEMETTSGEIETQKCDIKNININGTSADIELNLSGSEEDYDYDIQTTSGDIKVGTMETERKYSTNGGKNQKIAIDITSGDTKIAF